MFPRKSEETSFRLQVPKRYPRLASRGSSRQLIKKRQSRIIFLTEGRCSCQRGASKSNQRHDRKIFPLPKLSRTPTRGSMEMILDSAVLIRNKIKETREKSVRKSRVPRTFLIAMHPLERAKSCTSSLVSIHRRGYLIKHFSRVAVNSGGCDPFQPPRRIGRDRNHFRPQNPTFHR